jgi:hypothetical protein
VDRPPPSLCFVTPGSLPATQGQRWKDAEKIRRNQLSASYVATKGRLLRDTVKVASDLDRMATGMKVAGQYVKTKQKYDGRCPRSVSLLAEHTVDSFSAMIFAQSEWAEALQVIHEALFSAISAIAFDKLVTLDSAKDRNVSTMSSLQLP